MKPIKAQTIDNKEARYAEAKPKNESLVKINFFGEDKQRIASRLILIPSDEELSDETIWRIAGVELI